MIFLKVKEKGHYLEIPGLSPFRTPVKANITHVSIGMVVAALKRQGIVKFEIVSDIPGKEQHLTQDDFKDKVQIKSKEKDKESKLGKKISKLENMIAKLLTQKTSKSTPNQEQITKRLDSIEGLILSGSMRAPSGEVQEGDGPVIEELDTFIPEVDIGGMKMSGTSVEEKMRDEDDTDEAADLLSSITGK